MSEKNIMQRKRPHGDKEKQDSKKRKIQHVTPDVNGLVVHRNKKAPRLSTALFHDNCEIQYGSLRQLINYAVLGNEHTTQASWCSIHHQKHLQGVVVVILEDLSQHHFYQFFTHFRCLRKLFQHRFSLPPPPSDFLASLVGLDLNDDKVRTEEQNSSNPHHSNMNGPVNELSSSSATRIRLAHDPIVQKYGRKRHGLTRYLLSEEEMRKYDYPCVDFPDTKNYVHSNCMEVPTDHSPLFGLDCEMCLTTKGRELTRVSLVDANGYGIMDELVLPDNPIQNYLTMFSGITKEMLLPVKTKLKDVQEKLKRLLPPDAVLVGHSLNNDLRALQMIHPNVIDTSLLFIRKFGKKFKLKFLAQAVLKRDIQSEDIVGHEPSEDAAAALRLAQYFIEFGPEKVAHLNLESIFIDPNNELNNTISGIKENGLLPHTHLQHTNNSSLVDSLKKLRKKITYVSMESVSSPKRLAQFRNVLCTTNEEVSVSSGTNKFSLCTEILILECKPVACFILKCSWLSFMFATWEQTVNKGKMQVTRKYEEMITVFAGPFKKPVCLKSVRMHFQSCGPIHSLNLVVDTFQPYVCIKYSVLEAAQLAVKHLNGTYVDGCCIKVQRLITSMSLDYEDLIKEMEEDPENSDTIYVSGFMKPLTESFLQQQFSDFKEIKTIYAPKNPMNQQHEKYCFLKFESPESAAMAAARISTHGGLMCQKAVTSSHLLQWFQEAVLSIPPHPQPSLENIPKAVLPQIISNTDMKINKLYTKLAVNTLCIILFPGNRNGEILPGFGLMGIKK
ncbi:RNA exonuclease 5 [Pyxicephalus adspersus]|uniref:RNA exonuclease 5 n=1 Tax=Pyxicephalus adspersus TaxID=30357 RepID=UPI003B5B31DB